MMESTEPADASIALLTVRRKAFQPEVPLEKQSSDKLLANLKSDDAWLARHSLRLLQERQLGENRIAKAEGLSILAAEALGLNDEQVLRTWFKSTDLEQLDHAIQLAAATRPGAKRYCPT